MAGPSAGVLIDFGKGQPKWRDLLEPFASKCSEGDCWISNTTRFGGTHCGVPRPFVGSIEPFQFDASAWPGEAAESIAIQDATGGHFTHQVVVAAMCNQAVDHQVLCEVVAEVARVNNGLIDFDFIHAPADIGLQVVTWQHLGRQWQTVVGTHQAASRWRSHPAFHMCK